LSAAQRLANEKKKTGSYHGAWPPELTTCPFELTCPKFAEFIGCPNIPALQPESSEHAHNKAMVLNMIKHRTILYAILTDFARQLSMPVPILCGRVLCRAFSLSCKAIVDTQFKSFNQNPFKAFFKLPQTARLSGPLAAGQIMDFQPRN
jgi:hypothetical protein